jgi:hypothetical protein
LTNVITISLTDNFAEQLAEEAKSLGVLAAIYANNR